MSGYRTHERIELHDSWVDIIEKLGEGHPGASKVLCLLLRDRDLFQIGSPLGILQTFMALDSAGIFGEDIWILYKDICSESLDTFIAVLRATDFYFVTPEFLRAAVQWADHRVDLINVIDLEEAIKELKDRLPDFGRKAEVSA